MKKNNKGFMLIEVIVTSTIIVTVMIGLYASFNKLYINYNVRNKYNDIDTIYATKLVFQNMIDKNIVSTIVNKIFAGSHYDYLIKDGVCNSSYFDDGSLDCSQLPLFYNVDNIVFVEYDLSSIKELETKGINETFKEYIKYVISYYGISDDEGEYSYLLLTEVYDGDDYFYANLRVR